MSCSEQALVIFSGGQDSTTCLLQALVHYGPNQVQAISFIYGQRHAIELDCARAIAEELGVKQHILDLSLMAQITHNALMDAEASIKNSPDGPPNTMVDGRNALRPLQ
ncbi:7-cyano-7-deazaguanine synthase [Oligella urethralis]|uniref:7-cyano-7-deazaguanine synthase n=1 Tax=Oligella urethralis TaxID=90245 RepID=UPI000A50B831|nr:7-cyano-7-deazaguanine synthase [Oligella urethralis]